MTVLYSNGCSYTANYDIAREQRYPIIVANHYGWDVHDSAIPGSCNDRIIRCTIRDCLELVKQDKSVVALVQLTHTHRTEYAGTPSERTAWKYATGDLFESVKPWDPTDLPDTVIEWSKLGTALFNETAETSKLCASVLGLAAFFKQHNIEYFIYSAPKIPELCIPEDFYNALIADPGVIDFKNFSMLGLTGDIKHPTETGMKVIADYFIDKLAYLAN
jgi:hypothetical protein